MIFGNLLALQQQNIKRLLAYSSIAHFGYLIVAFLPGNAAGVEASVFYLLAYSVTLLAAFGVVTVLSTRQRDADDLNIYQGLFWRDPIAALVLTVALLSLAGIPITAGFIGKFYVFYALVEAGGPWMIGLLVIAGINTAVSLVYYLRVAKTVCIDAEPAGRRPVSIGLLPAVYVLLVTLPVLVYGIFPAPVLDVVRQATKQLLS